MVAEDRLFHHIFHHMNALRKRIAELAIERDELKAACRLALGQLRFAREVAENRDIHSDQFDLAIAECEKATSRRDEI